MKKRKRKKYKKCKRCKQSKENVFSTKLYKVYTKLKRLLLTKTPSPSMFYLATAIVQGSRVFLTADTIILQNCDIIEKKFPIKISSDYNEAVDVMGSGRRKTPFENYLKK